MKVLVLWANQPESPYSSWFGNHFFSLSLTLAALQNIGFAHC